MNMENNNLKESEECSPTHQFSIAWTSISRFVYSIMHAITK